MPYIVFKCENDECPHPDVVIADPIDDNLPCECGGTRWGHWKHKEDLEKKKKWEQSRKLPCGWRGATHYEIIPGEYGDWPRNSCCGGN